MKKMSTREFMSHFCDKFPKNFLGFAENYIKEHGEHFLVFGDRNDKEKAYCTSCRKDVVVHGGPKMRKRSLHNTCPQNAYRLSREDFESVICPNCGKRLRSIRLWANKNFTYRENHYLINYYAKSQVDKNIVTCQGVEFRRIYDKLGHVHLSHKIAAWYLFRQHGPNLMIREGINGWTENGWTYKKVEQGTINDIGNRSESFNWYDGHMLTYMYSFKHAIRHTFLQYCCNDYIDLCRLYGGTDNLLLIKYLDLYKKHPWIELLIKGGYQHLIEQYLGGRTFTYYDYQTKNYKSFINWRTNSIKHAFVVKLNPDDQKYLNSHQDDFVNLMTVKAALASGNFDVPLKDIGKHFDYTLLNIDNLKAVINLHQQKLFSFQRLDAYYKRQKDLGCLPHGSGYRQKTKLTDFQIDYIDYLHDCLNMGIDLTNKSNLYPENLYKRQEALSKVREDLINKNLEKNLAARLPALIKLYSFQDTKYLIRPVQSIEEIIDEGKRQHNCVGGYAEDYANGATNILVLRRKKAPKKNFVTVEILRNKQTKDFILVQARAHYNENITNDVKEFLKKYFSWLQNKNKKSTDKIVERIKVAA